MGIEASTNRAMAGVVELNPDERASRHSRIGNNGPAGTARIELADRGVGQQAADMADAEDAFRMLAADGVELVWQPVRDARDNGAILYHEALARFPDEGDRDASPARHLQALERLGLAPAFDREIVGRVIEALRADPFAVLGVNISAQSADTGGWWTDVAPLLREHPGIARRLVIEITETTPYPSTRQAIAFAAEARALGCRVALDDFGVGHASLHTMLALSPAIIKIDALFVRTAASSAAAGAMFRHLVGLAVSTGALAVVEGIETPEQAARALDAGATWQQGYLHGRPSCVRSRDIRPRLDRPAAFSALFQSAAPPTTQEFRS